MTHSHFPSQPHWSLRQAIRALELALQAGEEKLEDSFPLFSFFIFWFCLFFHEKTCFPFFDLVLFGFDFRIFLAFDCLLGVVVFRVAAFEMFRNLTKVTAF